MRKLFGALAALVGAWMIPFPAHAQDGRWLRLESPGFIVYTSGSEQRARSAAQDLEVFDALLRRMTDAPATRSPTKLEIYLLNSDQFHDAFHMGPNIAGFYRASVDQIAAYEIYSQASGFDGQDVLFHEYAHHFMYQYFNNAYPAWYVEGFAEFVATAVLGTERITLGRSNAGRFQSLLSGTWLPMDRLITAMPLSLNGSEMEMFYAQSWLFTHYLVLTPDANAKFQTYVHALRQGQSPEAAFQTGFGMTPAQMQAVLRAYLRSSPNAIALTRPAAVEHTPITSTHLSTAADDLMLPAAQLRQGVSDSERSPLLARVQQLAARYPGDSFATLTLARAEVTLGSHQTARTILEPFLTANPNDVEGLYLEGLSYLRDADDAEGDARLQTLALARRYFGRGFHQDGNNVPTLYRYAETYNGVGMNDATFDNYVNVLLLAHQLAPQVPEIGFGAAGALMSKGRNAEAIPILRALAYDPHGGGAAQTAQHMLEQAQAAAQSDATH